MTSNGEQWRNLEETCILVVGCTKSDYTSCRNVALPRSLKQLIIAIFYVYDHVRRVVSTQQTRQFPHRCISYYYSNECGIVTKIY